MSTKFAPSTRSPEHERVLEAHVAADAHGDYTRWRRIAITAVATVVLFGLVIIDLATTHDTDTAQQRAACARVATDLKALADTADREADRQEFVRAAQGMVNAVAHQPGSNWEDAQADWSAAYGTQTTEDNYRAVLAKRAQENLAACRG